jgi:bacterial/archaeal transporter family protein
VIDWLAPALGFALAQGTLGVTTKVALRTIDWPQLLLWTALAYAGAAVGMLATQGTVLPLEPAAGWAALSGFLAASSLIAFFGALRYGLATQVVPVTAAYPVATLIFAAIILAERITPVRVLGTCLVVAGVVVLGRK